MYSSVGHGGASGYLAVLALFAFSQGEMRTTALILNVIVAGIACVTYMRAGHLTAQLTIPFILTSIPVTFIGGMLHVTDHIYFLLLGIALVVAALRLALPILSRQRDGTFKPLNLSIALPIG